MSTHHDLVMVVRPCVRELALRPAHAARRHTNMFVVVPVALRHTLAHADPSAFEGPGPLKGGGRVDGETDDGRVFALAVA